MAESRGEERRSSNLKLALRGKIGVPALAGEDVDAAPIPEKAASPSACARGDHR